MEAAITKPSVPKLDLVLITVHVAMVSVVMVLCALQLIRVWSKMLVVVIVMLSASI